MRKKEEKRVDKKAPFTQGSSAEGGEGLLQPVSATPARALRALANPFAQGSFFINPFLFFFSHAKRYIKAKKLLKKSIKYDII